tara:strand:- start:2291 stop:2968 length:678 start_codon:yes stop_codon:yes gene_type:complete
MSVLDYLLPKSFMSDVQTTFRPKLISEEDFPDGGAYNVYKDLVAQGYGPTADFMEMIGLEYDNALEEWVANNMGFSNIPADSPYLNPDSPAFMFTSNQPINIFGGQSLAEGFERAGVYDFDPAMAKPAELSTLRALDPGSYAKETSMKRGTLADSLARQRAKVSQIGGGFAGYGGRNVAEDLAEQQFVEGSQAIMEDVNKQRANALQQLYSELEDYGSIIEPMNM